VEGTGDRGGQPDRSRQGRDVEDGEGARRPRGVALRPLPPVPEAPLARGGAAVPRPAPPLGEHYAEVEKQADRIAERITALGGIPTCDPVAQAKIAYLAHEPEGTFRIRPSLESDRSHEGGIAKRLRSSIRLAQKLGDFGSEHLLKETLLEVEDRAHHLDHFLGNDSLEIGRID